MIHGAAHDLLPEPHAALGLSIVPLNTADNTGNGLVKLRLSRCNIHCLLLELLIGG